MKNIFLLSWKKVIFIVVSWFVFVILHNAFYAFFGSEEPVFFIIAVFIIPFYFFVCVFTTLLLKFKKNGNI